MTTTATKHTFGPWTLDPSTRRIGTTQGTIAKVETYDDRTGRGFTAVEQDANARLIAAAPDLLVMLERLLDEVMMTEACFSHVARLTLEQARNAIAKAYAQ